MGLLRVIGLGFGRGGVDYDDEFAAERRGDEATDAGDVTG